MAITIELTPEQEAALMQQAANRGTEPNVLAYHVLLHHLLANHAEAVTPCLPPAPPFEEQTWVAVLQALAEDSQDFPAIPPDALTAEDRYSDHD